MIIVLPIIVTMLILGIIVSVLVNDKKRIREIIDFQTELKMDITPMASYYLNSKGIFINLSKDIVINLEAHKQKNNKVVLDDIFNTIVHEDLHKSMFKIGIGGCGQHWAIEKVI